MNTKMKINDGYLYAVSGGGRFSDFMHKDVSWKDVKSFGKKCLKGLSYVPVVTYAVSSSYLCAIYAPVMLPLAAATYLWSTSSKPEFKCVESSDGL